MKKPAIADHRFDRTSQTIGACSLCGGRVARPYPVKDPWQKGKCDNCNAIEVGFGPIIKMEINP